MGVANDQASPTAASHQTPGSSRKRKHDIYASTPAYPTPRSSLPTPGSSSIDTAICLDDDDYDNHASTDCYVIEAPPSRQPTSAKRAKRAADGEGDEKRLRQTRKKPPQSFYDVFSRATTQRFYVLSRIRCGTQECPEEMVEIAGTTGNIYYVCVARQPTCDCPHARKGAQCKHLLYVLSRVLRAKFDYVYQLALLSSELRDIFANAPPIAAEHGNTSNPAAASQQGNRKPLDDDCPICFNELVGQKQEGLVWCRAACGQNMHKECFEMWAATKRKSGTGVAGSEVTCPLCRSVWQGDDEMVNKSKKTGKVNSEGYVNVADQLGISTRRDTSTYSRWWSGFDNRQGRGHRRRYDGDDGFDEW